MPAGVCADNTIADEPLTAYDCIGAVQRVRATRDVEGARIEPQLRRMGLTMFELVRLADEVAGPDGNEAIRAAGRLHFMYEFNPIQIHEMAGMPLGSVLNLIDRSPRSTAQAEVLKLHNEGLSVAEIHAQTALKRSVIYRYLNEGGLTPNRTSRKYSATDKRRMLSLRRQGMSYGKIALTLGFSRSEVEGVIRHARARGLG